jgi:hypothetical protein
MFVAPTPDPLVAVRILKTLSERSPASELGTAHAAHLLHKSRSSSQITTAPATASACSEAATRTSLVSLDVLEVTSSTLTVCWCCSGDSDYFVTDHLRGSSGGESGAVREDIGPVKLSVRRSIDQMVFAWQDVYQGEGRGCTIEYLEPNTLYHIRLLPLLSSFSATPHQPRTVRGAVYISARTEERES